MKVDDRELREAIDNLFEEKRRKNQDLERWYVRQKSDIECECRYKLSILYLEVDIRREALNKEYDDYREGLHAKFSRDA